MNINNNIYKKRAKRQDHSEYETETTTEYDEYYNDTTEYDEYYNDTTEYDEYYNDTTEFDEYYNKTAEMYLEVLIVTEASIYENYKRLLNTTDDNLIFLHMKIRYMYIMDLVSILLYCYQTINYFDKIRKVICIM
jgi:hypothetical protein